MNFSMPTDAHELKWLSNIAIEGHCSINAGGRFTPGFGVWYHSTLSHLLAEANHAKCYQYSGKLLPLLAALSAMDQLGTCYDSVPMIFPSGYADKSGIIKSAHNFLGIQVDTPDSDALYALRNSLMHQSSLISVGKQKKNPKHFWFEVDNNIPELFTHCPIAWNGLYNTRTASNKTIVNAGKVLNLALALVEKMKAEHQKGKVLIALPNGLLELLTTYVELEFSDSFRDSYIRYLAEMVHRSHNSPFQGADEARRALADAAPAAIEEATAWLKSNGGSVPD